MINSRFLKKKYVWLVFKIIFLVEFYLSRSVVQTAAIVSVQNVVVVKNMKKMLFVLIVINY
jgi:hypothetical protein